MFQNPFELLITKQSIRFTGFQDNFHKQGRSEDANILKLETLIEK